MQSSNVLYNQSSSLIPPSPTPRDESSDNDWSILIDKWFYFLQRVNHCVRSATLEPSAPSVETTHTWRMKIATVSGGCLPTKSDISIKPNGSYITFTPSYLAIPYI